MFVFDALKIIKAFNSNEKPWQLSLGAVLGATMGLTPLLSLHNLVLLLVALIIRVNMGLLILSLTVFSGFAYLFDPVIHQIGYSVLTADRLQSMWTQFFTCPIFVLANFNNTLIMGGLLFSLAAAIPFFFLFNFLLTKYRKNLEALTTQFPILKSLFIFNLKKSPEPN